MIRLFIVCSLVLFSFSSCFGPNSVMSSKNGDLDKMEEDVVLVPPALPDNTAKNIIFLIGDGMALPQITASYYNNGKSSVFERFPIIGIQHNYSADSLTTDSAAAATAFACGVKTNNRVIGMDPAMKEAESILSESERRNKKTGIVVCSSIVHATPAAFFAHSPSRYNYEEMAEDFVKSGVDYFVGGGKKFFDRRTKDDRELSKELRAAGYFISDYFEQELAEIDLEGKSAFGYFSADDSPLKYDQGRRYMDYAVKEGIKFLESENGYFLLVEGSQIDWGGHARNIDYVLSEMEEFEQILNAVLDYAETDGETLVIVTGDHETGGLTINFDSKPGSLSAGFSSKHHSAVMVPVFAFGPGANFFSGMYDNTAIYGKMRKAFGYPEK